MTIFVSIASYRDSQLGPTVRDCLANADLPGELRFGICWQHSPDEPWPLDDDPRLRVLDVDYRDSRGACWARAQIGDLVSGEDWYLQLDSHHRFAPGWDTQLIAMAESTGSPRPIISTYPTGFTLPEEPQRNVKPWQITFGRWTPEGIPLFRPRPIRRWRRMDRPLRARFIGACFIFTRAQWVTDVPYDPELYFTGEEISLAVRSFTSGYDFFHPHRTLVWHEWSRSYRTKHWTDHTPSRGAATPWWELNDRSMSKVRDFLCEPHTGPYGCGTERTIADYQAYCGLDFAHCRAQEYTLQDREPPNPPATRGWHTVPRPWQVTVVLQQSLLAPQILAGDSVWQLEFFDHGGRLLDTATWTGADRDAAGAGHAAGNGTAAGNGAGRLSLTQEFISARTPVKWQLSAISASLGGTARTEGAIVAADRRRGIHCAYIANRLLTPAG